MSPIDIINSPTKPTFDKNTLEDLLKWLQEQFGKAQKYLQIAGIVIGAIIVITIIAKIGSGISNMATTHKVNKIYKKTKEKK